jgi:hypothetical protein
LFIVYQSTSFAQEWKTDRKINVLFGLSQPLLVDRFNIEVNYIHNRLIFNYSHGTSLDFSGSTATEDLERQGVTVHMPWTTGFGVGYRLNNWLNVALSLNGIDSNSIMKEKVKSVPMK